MAESRTVKIIDRNEFYNANGSDAEFIAEHVLKSKNSLKHGDGNDVYVTLTKSQFELVLKELVLSLGCCVEIYSGSGGKANFSQQFLQAKVSPGNFGDYENLLLGSQSSSSPAVAAVKFAVAKGSLTIGVAAVDVNTRKFTVLEVADDDRLANLETVLVQLGIRECLAAQSDPVQDKLSDICSLSNIHLTYMKKSDYDCKDIIEDLNNLIRFPKTASKNAAMIPETKLELAMCSLSAVIRFLDLLGSDTNRSQFRLDTFNPREFMRLDASAVVALNLTPKPGEAPSSCFGSLFALLNHCRTQLGQRLLLQWIKQPLIDLDKINGRLDLVEMFVDGHEVRRDFHETHLRGVQDLQRLCKKLVSKRATLQDLYKVYQTVQKLPKMAEALAAVEISGPKRQALEETLLSPLKEVVEDFGKFSELIETTVDFDYFEATREFRIKPEFDEVLSETRDQLDEVESRAESALQDCISETEIDSVKLERSWSNGFFYRITQKDEKNLRHQKQRYTVVETTKGAGVRFRNRALETLSDRFVALSSDYEDKQRGLVGEIVGIASGYAQPLLDAAHLLATVDVFVALAVAAVSAPVPFVRPRLLPLGAGTLRLDGVRHPCVEAQLGVSAFISNDIAFRRRGDTETAETAPSFYIVTGPNMGGKSTFLRSVALACLMAQMGSFVAADAAEIALVDAILARVGASDCIVRGVSTFMAEMLDTSVILKMATGNSLVIIDELGRGTSTYDGFGLAWAVSEHLVKKLGCFVLFATHFHELTRLADEYPSLVRNLHVSTLCDSDGLTFLYKLKPGPCGNSLGLQVAKMVHFPKQVLSTARDWADGLQATASSGNSGISMKQVDDAENTFREMLDAVKTLPSGDSSGLARIRGEFQKKILETTDANPFLQSLVQPERSSSE